MTTDVLTPAIMMTTDVLTPAIMMTTDVLTPAIMMMTDFLTLAIMMTIDLHTNGSEVEGGFFPEELVNGYPFLVLKCNSLRGGTCGSRTPGGRCPPRAPPQDMSQRKVQ